MQACFSNRVEKLYCELKSKLFSKETTPFTNRYVIVPSSAMKHWLMTTMAEDPDMGVAAGIHITYLDQAIGEIIAKLSVNSEQFPKKLSELELAIKLEVEIRKILKLYNTMAENERSIWEPLARYIISKEKVPDKYRLKNKELRRILSLSHKLANLFITYGNYGSRMLQSWKERKGNIREWQSELWKRCVNEVFPENFEWKVQNCTIHLFGLSFISEQQHKLFISLARKNPVYFYLLSPCQVFWSEILSDRECRKLITFWQKKGVEEAQQNALEEYIYDRNTLLANLGRVGREMALQVENSDMITKENYEVPENFNEYDAYAELMDDNIEFSERYDKISLLNAIQADLLLMRNVSQHNKFNIKGDQSIQLLVTSSPMREIQTIYDVIIGLIQKHRKDKNPILPEDIIIMAPDIIKYEPYIRSVFSQAESKLDFQVMDLNTLSQQPLVQGFMCLLSLSRSRWDVSSILQLFENSAFQQKHGLSFDDLVKIKSWIKAADVRWGEDPKHRAEVINRELEELCYIDSSSSGTWKNAIERFLLGMSLILPDDFDGNEVPVIPLNNVDTSQAALFGKWIQLLSSLKEDLKPLVDGSEFTLKKWSIYLKSLFEAYFETSRESGEGEAQSILDIIEGFKFEHKFVGETFSFSTIQFHLDIALSQQRLCYRESHLHAVKFCSMLPMRALPAKVVVLLGMSDENYPRCDKKDSLNMLRSEIGSDYCPTQSEFDRYLFLETILSARNYFILSYCGYSQSDGKEQSPSLLISELLGYLDSGYTVDNKKPSDTCLKKCPFYSYDRKLFESNTPFQSYSEMYYRAAKTYYMEDEKLPQHIFIPSFDKSQGNENYFEECIEIKKLVQFAKNPIESYLKNCLGMYLSAVEDSQKRNEEDFILDIIDNAIIKKHTLKKPLISILNIAEKEGKLPIGPFKECSIEKLRFEVDEIKKGLIGLGIDLDCIFSIKCSENYIEPQRNTNGDWLLPPLEMTCGENKIKIVGDIQEVSSSGMIAFIKDDKKDIIKSWPQYLVYLCLIEYHQILFEKNLIFAKSGRKKSPFFENPFSYLEKYIKYYFYSQNIISPLIPEWVPYLIENDIKKFEKIVKETLSDKNKFFYNDYLKWILRGPKYPDHEILLSNWKNTAEDLFGELYQNWYTKGKAIRESN